jgi:tRNA (guanine37-N1)-methyltransferase
VQYLRENALLNKLEIVILQGDAIELAADYENTADHVIMNLPHSAAQFLPQAIAAARPGGVVHYYTFALEEDLWRDQALIKKAAEPLGASIEVLYLGVVRSYAPRRYNVVIDFRVSKPQG